MRRSDDRVLVTHVGSLPRPPDLLELLLARENGEPYDARRLDELQARGVSGIVRRQLDLGIDVVNDGELGKTSFLSYVNTRLGGLERRASTGAAPWATLAKPRRSRSITRGRRKPTPAAPPPPCIWPPPGR